jgi:hypothetical protein
MAGINPRQPLSSAIAIRQLLTSAIAARQTTTPATLTLTYETNLSYESGFLYNTGIVIPGVAIPRATTPANVAPRVSASASMKWR